MKLARRFVLRIVAVLAIAVLVSCGSGREGAPKHYEPVFSAPPVTVRAEHDNPLITTPAGDNVFLLQPVGCTSTLADCAAFSVAGSVYVRGGWSVNPAAEQALGKLVALDSSNSVEVRQLFADDSIFALLKPGSGDSSELIVAAWATRDPAFIRRFCSAASRPDNQTLVDCSDPLLLDREVQPRVKRLAGEVLGGECADLPATLRGLQKDLVHTEGGSSEAQNYEEVIGLVDAAWLQKSCAGNLVDVATRGT